MNYAGVNMILSTLLADSSNNFFTELERQVAINTACSHMNSELRILMTTVTIAVSPENPMIPLPEDFVSFGKGVNWIQGNTVVELEAGTPSRLRTQGDNWENTTGVPSTYVLDGPFMVLYPTPTTEGAVRLSYLAMPNIVSQDTDELFYGDPRVQAYHDVIAYRAAWQLALKDRDFEAAQQFWTYFQMRMVDLRENLRQTGDVITQPVWSDTYSS